MGYYKEKAKFKINQILVALDNLEHLIYYLTSSQKMCLEMIIDKWVTEQTETLLLYNISVSAANLHQCLISDYTLGVPLLKEQLLRPNLSWGKIRRTQ